MKKIIRGRVYDTATARFVGKADNGYGRSDFHFYEETLYAKKTGEYFLYGIGGPLSKYGVWHGNEGDGSEQIIPLSFDKAKEWAENAMDADEYIAEFGDPEKDDSKQTYTVSLTITTINKLKRAAAQRDKSVSQIIDELAAQL